MNMKRTLREPATTAARTPEFEQSRLDLVMTFVPTWIVRLRASTQRHPCWTNEKPYTNSTNKTLPLSGEYKVLLD